MTKRILSLTLAILMIAASLTVFISAAQTDSSLTAMLASVKNETGSVIIVIGEVTYVNTDTIVPANVTVSIAQTGKLVISGAKLTVYGKLNATDTQITYINGGSISFPNSVPTDDSVYYYWTRYDPNRPWTKYPVSGPHCSKCGKDDVIWCPICNTYHCTSCTSHYIDNTNKCAIHKTPMTLCSMCGEYYCPACVGGVHGYDTVNKKCVIIPYNDTNKCAIHGSDLYYCQNCKKYYCPSCIGGVHTVVNGQCVIYNGSTPGVCTTHNIAKTYCSNCKKYYCPLCEGGYHVYNSFTGKCTTGTQTDYTYYCSVHGTAKAYCAHCNKYYCPLCEGGYHIITGANTPCVISGGTSNPNYNDYYYYGYVYIPGYGYVATNIICAAPTASVANGSAVQAGTLVYLSSSTPNAKIYYTTDGSTPNVGSTLYTGPIAINKAVTIRAMAAANTIANSPVANFSYTVKAAASASIFTDIKGYTGLADVLDKLLDEKVIVRDKKFNPEDTVSWDDLKSWLVAIGVKTDRITADFFADPNEITYEELIVASYRILFANKRISSPRIKNGDVYSIFKYSSDITNTAITKAAYKSLHENNALYDVDFRPQSAASRVYLAFIIAEFC